MLCHAEPEAVDLLLETEKLEWLVQHVDAKNYARTCLYLTSCCAYLPEDDDSKVMQTAYQIYTKEKQYPEAMKVALMMNDQVMLLGPEEADSLSLNTVISLEDAAAEHCTYMTAGASKRDPDVLRRSPYTEAAGLPSCTAR